MTEQLNTIKASVSLTAILENLIDGGGRTASVSQGVQWSPATALTSGTTANKADRIWQDSARTLVAATNEDLDLFDAGTIDIGAGAGRDALGQPVANVELVGLLIVNQATSAGDLIIGGNGTAAAFNSIFNGSDTAQLSVHPGGVQFIFSPDDPSYVITDATNHLLRLAASGGDVTYDIAGLFRSA